MKRVILTWEDDASRTLILGTTREIQSLSKNLYKRFGYYYHYCQPFKLKGAPYTIWAICPDDGCIIAERDIPRWIYNAKEVKFT